MTFDHHFEKNAQKCLSVLLCHQKECELQYIYRHKTHSKMSEKEQLIIKYFVLPSTPSTEIWYGDTRGHHTLFSWTCD